MKCARTWAQYSGVLVLLLLAAVGSCRAQEIGAYSNRKVLSGFVEYSNDSSHMLLGYAEGRKITALGVGFERRNLMRNGFTGSFMAEVRPYMRVVDPTEQGFTLFFPQQPSYSGQVRFNTPVPVDRPVTSKPENVVLVMQNHVYSGTATYIGGTRSTYVTAFSPLGYKVSLFPHHRIQPFFTSLGGFAISPRDIPVFNSSSFNFTLEVGGGLQIYQSHTRSCQLEYRYHHLANAGAGSGQNPGIDSGVMKVTYSFGR
jgi:hypothetical protein